MCINNIFLIGARLVTSRLSSSRVFISFVYCSAFVGLGFIIASLGPCLLALETQISADGMG
jgi:hypothetical protein